MPFSPNRIFQITLHFEIQTDKVDDALGGLPGCAQWAERVVRKAIDDDESRIDESGVSKRVRGDGAPSMTVAVVAAKSLPTVDLTKFPYSGARS